MKYKICIIIKFFIFYLTSVSLGSSQVLQNIENDVGDFPTVNSNLTLSFPHDHAAHEKYQIEWWYLTSNLIDKHDKNWGLQWTLFRLALEPNKSGSGWGNSQIWMGHAATTNATNHYFIEKFARGGVQQAGVTINPFRAWIDDWRLEGDNWKNLTVSANSKEFAFRLNLNAVGPLIPHGDAGFSIKSSSGHASGYYSQPFFLAKGWIETDGVRHEVEGVSWADHEWASQLLTKNLKGWDWFSLHFETGEKLMLFRVREADDKYFYSGTWIYPNGKSQNILNNEIELKPVLEVKSTQGFKTQWKVKIDKYNLNITTKPLNPEAFMNTSFPYWEGPIKSSGTHAGRGYLEITGF